MSPYFPRISPDWKKEKETRVIITGLAGEDRLVTYDFKQVKGIIFGYKVSRTDKLSIINLVKEKLKTHSMDSFELYDMIYVPGEMKMQRRRIEIDLTL